MKKFIYTLLIFVVATGAAVAQSVFSLIPNPATVTVSPDVLDSEAHMTFRNLTSDTIRIRWERVVVSALPGMQTQVCDPILCWAPQVSTKTYTTPPNEEVALIVHFLNHDVQEGSAVVHLKLTNLDNLADTATAVFLYNPTVDTKDPLPLANITLFPNPAIDYFMLDQAEAVRTIRLFSLDGRQVMTFDAAPGHRYPLDGQPAGTYIVALEDARGRMFQAIEVRKQ